MKYLALIILLSTTTAYAEEPPDVPPGDDVITSLDVGDPAPHAGQLLDTDTAIRWTNRLRWYSFRLRLMESEYTQSTDAIEQSWMRRIRILDESYQREILGLREDLRGQAEDFAERLSDAENTAWYETWTFGFIVGTALTTAVVIAISVAVAKL